MRLDKNPRTGATAHQAAIMIHRESASFVCNFYPISLGLLKL